MYQSIKRQVKRKTVKRIRNQMNKNLHNKIISRKNNLSFLSLLSFRIIFLIQAFCFVLVLLFWITYNIKSNLGIDLFPEIHLNDLLEFLFN